MDTGDETIRSYQAHADRYLAADREPSAGALAWQAEFIAMLPAAPLVLELGSGPGADADRLESRGVRVLRSDATPAFVSRLRALGHPVLAIDVRRDPLPRELDGVFANAVLLHLSRDEFAAALLRIRAALRRGGVGCGGVGWGAAGWGGVGWGGVLACSLKEGGRRGVARAQARRAAALHLLAGGSAGLRTRRGGVRGHRRRPPARRA